MMHRSILQGAPLVSMRDAYAKYRGKWIAMSADGNRIVVSADDLDSLEDQLAAAGVDPQQVIFDQIENDDICLGGAELL